MRLAQTRLRIRPGGPFVRQKSPGSGIPFVDLDVHTWKPGMVSIYLPSYASPMRPEAESHAYPPYPGDLEPIKAQAGEQQHGGFPPPAIPC